MKIIEVPMTFLRDYTTPMAEHSAWNRTRVAIIPIFLTLAFFWLGGALQEDEEYETWIDSPFWLISLIMIGPGILACIYILFKTKVSKAPEWLMTVCAVVCFVMSIIWIKFSCDCIMDLLTLFGFVS